MLDNTATTRGAAAYTPIVLKLYDWWVLGVSNRFAWQCPTKSTLLPFFTQHVGPRHLDVGVGTGFYLANTQFAPATQLTLIDLNQNSLNAAALRSRREVKCIRHNIMQPLPLPKSAVFDSISMFYLLHCLPGTFAEKETAIVHLKERLAQSGTLYGATILGDGAGHNWFGQKLMTVYNRKGIFGNKADSLDMLNTMLKRHFGNVEIGVVGKVALFIAREPNRTVNNEGKSAKP